MVKMQKKNVGAKLITQFTGWEVRTERCHNYAWNEISHLNIYYFYALIT